MTFESPWMCSGLVAVGAVLWLHLKPRRDLGHNLSRRWGCSTGVPRLKLRSLLILLGDILAIVALVLAVPRPGQTNRQPRPRNGQNQRNDRQDPRQQDQQARSLSRGTRRRAIRLSIPTAGKGMTRSRRGLRCSQRTAPTATRPNSIHGDSNVRISSCPVPPGGEFR